MKSPIIVALDMGPKNALDLAKEIDPQECKVKVGSQLFTSSGPIVIEKLNDLGFDVFLDLKFHDIPNTVAKAVTAAAELGVWMVNVHASGGPEMMSKAKQALEKYGDDAPLLIAVTILTSMDEAELKLLNIDKTPQEQVMFLANLAKESGLDGVVCSAQEATALKQALGQEFKLVTPGIRPAGSAKGDQKRVMTPKEAIDAGSDYLVIGRPITQATDPQVTLIEINDSLS